MYDLREKFFYKTSMISSIKKCSNMKCLFIINSKTVQIRHDLVYFYVSYKSCTIILYQYINIINIQLFKILNETKKLLV